MAKDSAATSFAARTPITEMDRPGVERELRHVHGDQTYYSTAHAARDALAAARAAVDQDNLNTALAILTTAAPSAVAVHLETSDQDSYGFVFRAVEFGDGTRSEIAGFTGEDAVAALLGELAWDSVVGENAHGYARIPSQARRPGDSPGPNHASNDRTAAPTPADDSSIWPSVQTYPIGTQLAVYGNDPDGTGRQLGHGTVVEHPGPEHVVVESPWGTRRTAALSHVQPAGQAPQTRPAPTGPSRWTSLLEAVHPSITEDPAWPALLALVDRIDSAGRDIPALIANALRDRALPDEHPARSLDYRLSDAVPDLARSAARPQPYQPPAGTPRPQPPTPPYGPPPRPAPPR